MTINTNKFKALLEALKNQIEVDITNAQNTTKPVELDQTMVGRLSRMDAMQQQQMALASERRRQQKLQKIIMDKLNELSNSGNGVGPFAAITRRQQPNSSFPPID